MLRNNRKRLTDVLIQYCNTLRIHKVSFMSGLIVIFFIVQVRFSTKDFNNHIHMHDIVKFSAVRMCAQEWVSSAFVTNVKNTEKYPKLSRRDTVSQTLNGKHEYGACSSSLPPAIPLKCAVTVSL